MPVCEYNSEHVLKYGIQTIHGPCLRITFRAKMSRRDHHSPRPGLHAKNVASRVFPLTLCAATSRPSQAKLCQSPRARTKNMMAQNTPSSVTCRRAASREAYAINSFVHDATASYHSPPRRRLAARCFPCLKAQGQSLDSKTQL